MWYKVNELWKKGLNKSQISRECHLDRGTVRKYLSMDEQSFIAWMHHPRRMPRKLSQYYKYVKGLLETSPYLSAAQVEDRLKENFPNLPQVDSKTIYNFVRDIRKKHDIPKNNQKQSRQYQKLPEPAYGSEAQVDFGEYKMQTQGGNRVKVYFFVMVLSRSRYKFVYCQRQPFTSQTAIYAHELAFVYFKGIPRSILYDQDKVFIRSENLGDVLLTDEFRRFYNHHSFEAIFCRKADPESKGKVENVVKYVKYNFLQGRKFSDQESLQQDCLAWLKRTGNSRVHGTTRKVPYQQWLIEREYLSPYSDTPEKPFLQLPCYKVRKDNTIAYRGNFYSLPLGTYKGQDTQILLEDKGDLLILYSTENELIASHKIPVEKGVLVRNTDHVREKSRTLQQKHELLLHALDNTPKALEYLSELEKDKPRYYHDNISVILKAVSNVTNKVTGITLDFCLENRVLNGYQFVDVLKHYQKEEENTLSCEKINISKVGKSRQTESLIPSVSNINFYEEII